MAQIKPVGAVDVRPLFDPLHRELLMMLRTLAPEDRDLLDDLPLREVDRRFDAWCEGREAAEGDAPG